MRRIYTTADYEIKLGRFLILGTISGDKYVDVPAGLVEGTDEAYQIALALRGSNDGLITSDSYVIHNGFIIASVKDPRDCAAILFVKEAQEASELLGRFLDDLNAYDTNA
jgi:hypothetical protein